MRFQIIFSGATLCSRRIFSQKGQAFATSVLNDILLKYPQVDIDNNQFDEMFARGKQSALMADWGSIATGPAAFRSSSDAVFHWAPMADELKCDDEEIVRNAIHLRWIGVWRDLKEVFQHTAIADDWRHQNMSL